MKGTARPSRNATLQGRLVGVLLLALVGVAALMLTMDFAAFRSSISERVAQRSAAQALDDALAEVDESVAGAIVRASEVQFNRSRQASGLPGLEDLLFQLQAGDGRLVYASAALRGRPPITREQAQASEVDVAGRAYWPWLHRGARWQIVLLEPAVRTGLLLRWLGGGMLPVLLIAVPLLVLPLWWAVRRGLAPLRALNTALVKRKPDDLSALGVDLRYAELQPIVGAVDALLTRAREHLARERELVHNAAHELRTPLAVVAAHAHTLAQPSGRHTAGDIEAAQQGIARGVQRATHLVDQLLLLARLESPSCLEAARAIDLAALCRHHLIDLAPLAEARCIETAFAGPDALPAKLEVNALHSILDNLLRNALNHCPAGSCIELRLGRSAQAVQIEVVDDGPGMAPDERQKAFERFYRSPGAGPGSGLGLAIVRQAAQRLGGDAVLNAGEGGRGLRVTVSFPA